MPTESAPHADHVRVDDTTTMVGVITRNQARRVEVPQVGWSTLPEPTAEGGESTRVAPAPRVRDSVSPVVGHPQSESQQAETPYGKIPDAITHHLLALQHRDAWLSQEKWKAYPDGVIPDGPFRGRWSEDNASLMRFEGAVYVPEDPATRNEILRANHDDPWQGGHFGKNKTLEVVKRYYWWPRMRNAVDKYVAHYDICQRMKVPRHKPYGLLVPLPRPERPWQDISLNFITGLPPAARRRRAYDAILVVVYRLTKMVRYIACTTEIDAPELGDRLVEEIFSKFGVPRSIVSDRGSVFTSSYWSTMCYYLAVKRRVLTAFHPQTDGQTERINQNLECYLRYYCNY